ncbi:helix-turn-helix transcriptional regulator [Aquicoccus porphyridii]|uniref:Helix-turn-helix transcriptional regulator n=1 Tax=Aquicoccus porphyridii TaxID=1852029 RepID=A0A5A9ZIK4_9RHOB|nr:helix-turn-helix transcriptional regulator [Aquicoccus porphyridii]KAA0916829.1 helix-turn-helix transcriptional regulator [Aquicoccus porphyridii]RAI53949.1 helix-turn-helix transcriptional regulator [Rhodobacteraceae bacterium AsT-22]
MLRHPWLLWALVLVQVGCGAYFLWEILAAVAGLPTIPLRWQTRELVDIGASLGLVLGAVLGTVLAVTASRDIRRAESARRLTAGEFTAVVDDYFRKLGLTPAETEVAWFLLKGMSLTEIAGLRNTREGTVKAQCTAIYRKADVSNKSQFFSLLVEDILL